MKMMAKQMIGSEADVMMDTLFCIDESHFGHGRIRE